MWYVQIWKKLGQTSKKYMNLLVNEIFNKNWEKFLPQMLICLEAWLEIWQLVQGVFLKLIFLKDILQGQI